MKIAFFSEIGHHTGTLFPRNYANARTDVAWAIALNARVFSIDTHTDSECDLGIIILPKDPERFRIGLTVPDRIRSIKKWAVMQEGPNWYFQDYDVHLQLDYIHFLSRMDFIFCHNKSDERYYSGIFPQKSVFVLPPLMIEDAIDRKKVTSPELRRDAIIGGNFTSWYSGVDSLIIAQELSDNVYAPSMGRKKEGEELIEGLEHYPYLIWNDWIYKLSERQYGVHLMRTHAAGTFALNCGYLGIPCIGYRGLDSQENLFPSLTIEIGDLKSARKIAKHLKEDYLFYNHVSEYAKKMYAEMYAEDVFVETFFQNIENAN